MARAFLICFLAMFASVAHGGIDECKDDSVSGLADCAEQGIFDICNLVGGKLGDAYCPQVQLELAERRLSRAVKNILARKYRGKGSEPASMKFLTAQKKWKSFRDEYCRFIGAIESFKEQEQPDWYATSEAYCPARLTEQRAQELETLLKNRWYL